jgi:peptide/nickel transport system permease protein
LISYIVNKALYALITLIGVVTVIFLLLNKLPGDAAQMILGQAENKEQIDAVRKKYGLDKSLSKQYQYFLNDLSPISLHSKNQDDFSFLKTNKYNATPLFSIGETELVIKWPYLRESYQKTDKKVSDIIAETLPNTFILAVTAIIIAIIIGIALGIVSALYKDRWLDRFIQVFSTLGMSVPSFFSAILFAWLFGYVLHQYTNLNMTGSFYEVDNFGEGILIQWKNLILPAIVLGIRPLAVIIQLMRNSLLEIMQQEYIRTAKAKGLNAFQVIRKHALKNALNPVVTAISGWFASMLAGAVFVEYIFGWNGLGKQLVEALNFKDLPVVTGSVLVIAFMFVIINIFVDVIYAWLDPKIRLK